MEIKKQEKTATLAAAKILQKGAEATLLAATHDNRLRNIDRKTLSGGRQGPVKGGPPLSVSARSEGNDAIVKAVGSSYAILDNPTRAHWIGIGRSTKRLKSGVAGPFRPGKKTGHAIKIGDNWVMGPILHPGTHGKHTFNIGTETATPEAFKVLSETIQLPVAGVFR